MKKITLLAAVFAFSITTIAQTIIIDRPNDGANSVISTEGTDAGVYCADYFTLDNSTSLGEITFTGTNSNGGEIASFLTAFNVFIYTDDSSVPNSNPTMSGEGVVEISVPVADLTINFDGVANADGLFESNFTIPFTASNGGTQITLDAGNYWMVVYPVVTTGAGGEGRWNWAGSSATPDVATALIDPDDLFGADATSWSDLGGLLGADFPSFNWTLTDEVLGLGDNDLAAVAVYPNPATDVLNVTLPSSVEVKSATLIDVLGKTTGVSLENGQMNIATLAAGVYILSMDTNLGSFTQKVIKQ